MSRTFKRISFVVFVGLVLYWISTLSMRFQLDFLVLFIVFLGLAMWAKFIRLKHGRVMRDTLQTKQHAYAISPEKSDTVEMLIIENGQLSLSKVQGMKIIPIPEWTEQQLSSLTFEKRTIDRGVFFPAKTGIRMSKNTDSATYYDFVLVDKAIGGRLSILENEPLDNLLAKLQNT